MFHYQLSKYKKPESDDSWTSISDIGDVFEGQELTEQEYLKWEESYIEILANFLCTLKTERLKILRYEDNRGLENTDKNYFNLENPYIKIRGGEFVTHNTLLQIFRLCLREVMWIRVEDIDGNYVTFGYDFYVNIGAAQKLSIEELNTTDLKLFLREKEEDPHE